MDAFFGLLAVIGLAVVYYGPWQWIMTDYARQRLFEKRDAIFDMAAAGKLDFDSNEYLTIRSSIESSIRFAHGLTFPKMIYLQICQAYHFVGVRLGEGESDFKSSIKLIEDAETRDQVSKILNEVNDILYQTIVFKSPILMGIFTIIILAVTCASGFSTAYQRLVDSFGNLAQIEAENSKFAPVSARTGQKINGYCA